MAREGWKTRIHNHEDPDIHLQIRTYDLHNYSESGEKELPDHRETGDRDGEGNNEKVSPHHREKIRTHGHHHTEECSRR